eukprot:TRINITY_DN29634_c0_g1_i1.p2 TRINITY_DN29634_c0_g1~~TRINITY_DN29634_c0_g1_i1.p2  ORF type:complete len:136 (+),score=34.40 TRINITY_DN29634_c0_g1_i1:846-1253(+)
MCMHHPFKKKDLSRKLLLLMFDQLTSDCIPTENQCLVVPQLVRRLFLLSEEDYQQKEIIQDVLKWKSRFPLCRYPLDEAKWLVSNVWNTGVSWHNKAKFGEAKMWISAAIDLQDALLWGEFPQQRDMMQKALEGI